MGYLFIICEAVLLFDDEHTLNFMGEDITFGQFMEGDFETKEAVDIEQN